MCIRNDMHPLNSRPTCCHYVLDNMENALNGKRVFHDPEQTGENHYIIQINNDVLVHLDKILGSNVLSAINHHLRISVNVDMSKVASEPRLVEAGLRKFFGPGTKVVIDQCILAAFRSVGLVPDRDFISLEDAILEILDKRYHLAA